MNFVSTISYLSLVMRFLHASMKFFFAIVGFISSTTFLFTSHNNSKYWKDSPFQNLRIHNTYLYTIYDTCQEQKLVYLFLARINNNNNSPNASRRCFIDQLIHVLDKDIFNIERYSTIINQIDFAIFIGFLWKLFQILGLSPKHLANQDLDK